MAENRSTREPSRFVVVGAVNWDFIAKTPQLPRPGETVFGDEIVETQGGKGANQAVAISRMGGSVAMIGRVGDDRFGSAMIDGLQQEGVETSCIFETPDCASGIALISVDDAGENAIVAVPGANARLSTADVRASRELIEQAEVLLVQFECPADCIVESIQIARQARTRVVLDPAPAIKSPDERLFDVEVMCPNATEAEALTGVTVTDFATAQVAAKALASRGAAHVVITLAERGAVLLDATGQWTTVPACQVETLDSTAAGDAFAGGIAIALSDGLSMPEAVRFACAAGAVAASRLGAMPSMPDRNEVETLLKLQSAAGSS